MARNSKAAAAKKQAEPAATVEPVTASSPVVATPEPEVKPESAKSAGVNESPEVQARFVLLQAIKESAQGDSLKKQAGEKGRGVYATLTALAALDAGLFQRAWEQVKEDIANNAENCAVIAGCELSKKTKKYNVPRSASVAASELLYAIKNSIPLVDAEKGEALAFGKIREANSVHRREALMENADTAEKALFDALASCHAFAGLLQKVQAAHASGVGRLSDHIDSKMLDAMRAVHSAIQASKDAFAEGGDE